jgi:hypothetical protein
LSSQRVGGPSSVGTSAAVLATGPCSIEQIIVTNTTGSQKTFTLSIGGTGGSLSLYSAQPVPANSSYPIRGPFTLNAGEALEIVGSASGLTATVNAAVDYPTVSPNSRYIVLPTGFPVGVGFDAGWSAAVQLDTTTLATYLDDVVAKGFAGTIISIIERFFNSNSDATHGNSLAAGLPFLSNLGTGASDFTDPNPTYFAWLRTVFQMAKDRNLKVKAVVMYTGSHADSPTLNQGWYFQMVDNGLSRCQTYAASLAQFNDFDNIEWVFGGDADPAMDPSALAIIEGMATELRVVDTVHLTTMHWLGDFASVDGGSSVLYMVNSTKGSPSTCASAGLSNYAHTPTLPMRMIEAFYEFNTTTDPQLRSQTYSSILSGDFEQGWGSEAIWDFDSGKNPLSPGGPWQNYLNTTARLDTGRANAFFASIENYQAMVPDSGNTFVTAGKGTLGTEDYCPGSLSPDGSLAMVYIPDAHTGTVTCNLSLMRGTVTAQWFDPTNATFSSAGSGLSGSHVFTRPGNNSAGAKDFLLYLTA